MAEPLDAAKLRTLLRNPVTKDWSPWQVLQSLCSIASNESKEHESRELVLRALEHRNRFNGFEEILDGLTRQLGLFPYLTSGRLAIRDAIAYEYHRPLEMGQEIVFHREQAAIYRRLLAGDSVILSAPTSFGKSKIIDAIVALKKFDNIAVIVPTIALIDETRRRLSRFRDLYKIVTQVSQIPSERNLFIFTAERAIAYEKLPRIGFFVIDEFYKLGALSEDSERTVSLNQAFYKLRKQGGQFYLLGPNIDSIPEGIESNFGCYFQRTSFSTVVSEHTFVGNSQNKEERLVEICKELDEPTLIYCKSPKSVNDVARLLFEQTWVESAPQLEPASAWIAKHFHSDWIYGRALAKGIGIHHGRLPRSLGQYVVRNFNELKLRFLICTSTLIEGVNTKAKNVIVFDNKIAQKNIDFFTFNNIRGRSGRMFEHFVGRVFLFDQPPQEDLPFVDFPLFTQEDSVPDSLLVQMDSDDLKSQSRARMEKYSNQTHLSIDTIRANSGIDPDSQIELSKHLSTSIDAKQLSWTQFPTYSQLKISCELIWEYLVRENFKHGVASGSQLCFKIEALRDGQSISERVSNELGAPGQYAAASPDEAVERVLMFDRNWASYDFPRYLMALSRIQEEVLSRRGLSPGNYKFYAAQVECLFGNPIVSDLDEFGIPVQLGTKLVPYLGGITNLDQALERLRHIDFDKLHLDAFESDVLQDAIAAM